MNVTQLTPPTGEYTTQDVAMDILLGCPSLVVSEQNVFTTNLVHIH